MTIKTWLAKNTKRLDGKTVALTGSTGGLGLVLSKHLVCLGASLILLDRNRARSEQNREMLLSLVPTASITCITLDLSEWESVKSATEQLIEAPPDIFIHNAGAYSIPRKICSTGYDNVYQINFVSPYYIIRSLLPAMRLRGGHVMAVGSIAHRYSKIDENDIDFHTRTAASRVYGNAKRYLMFSLYALFEKETAVTLAVTHPGITATNITAHYPKLVYALIKYPMRVIFMRPRRAVLSLLAGVFEETKKNEWFGPRFFDVWGLPKRTRLRSVEKEEELCISEIADEVFLHLKNDLIM
ncbi:MAG: SDR family NAD(P)-dependent oxidoreductase [Ruminococcaceae bacterium]|nr:SDR family NAD(P)-dependent oxidoreductase [Oscillospiraceae bacterium]